MHRTGLALLLLILVAAIIFYLSAMQTKKVTFDDAPASTDATTLTACISEDVQPAADLGSDTYACVTAAA